MGIGIDSFSYHRFFGEFGPYESRTSVRWTTADFLDRATELAVDAVALQTVYLPDLTLSTVDKLRGNLETRGLRPVLCWGHPYGLDGGRDARLARDMRAALTLARPLGCDLVRFVTGHARTFSEPVAPRIERLVPQVRALSHTAATMGLALALENHCDFRMADLVSLIEMVGAENLGICFDGVNAVRVGDDLFEAARLAAPYTRMVHLRNWRLVPGTSDRVDGFWPARSPEDGVLDIRRLLGVFEAAGYTGDTFIEIAYLHPDHSDEDAYVAEGVAFLRRLAAERQSLSAEAS